MRILVVGAGFFGMYISEYLAQQGHHVVLAEKETECMTHASYANQARVHNGYHYPRSVLTALRSRVSFPKFVEEFRDCIDSDFHKLYMVGRKLSKVTARQFRRFCALIDAPCEPVDARTRTLVNPALIEDVFSTVEYAFDAVKLRQAMEGRLVAGNVTLRLGTMVRKVARMEGRLRVQLGMAEESGVEDFDHVFNCTYSMLNYLNNSSEIEMIPLRHEMTEMCLTDVPDVLRRIGITVMCGPFFSLMPFPSTSYHTLSHVRYTPHYEWSDDRAAEYQSSVMRSATAERYSAWPLMQRDAMRYVPLVRECTYVKSIWEVKTILPRSNVDDSRPILFRANHGFPGFHCILGGKIDNVYDVIAAIEQKVNLEAL